MPFLNPHSADNYGQPFKHLRPLNDKIKNAGDLDCDVSSDLLLAAAKHIQRHLVHEAYWNNDRCSWIGPYGADGTAYSAGSWKAIGSDLYSGSSGVALFLAHLYALSGDPALRITALGAIRHSVSHIGEVVPRHLRIGLFTGLPGVTLAAALVGNEFEDDWCLAHCRRLVYQIAKESRHECGFDWMSGRAGAVVAALLLADFANSSDMLEYASILADEILAAAEGSGNSISWRHGDGTANRSQCGFAHGTAGVAFALLRLYQLSGRDEHKNAALMALEHERKALVSQPEARPNEEDPAVRGYQRRILHNAGWCNGTPGTALSWLLAYYLFRDNHYSQHALYALKQTYAIERRWLDVRVPDHSLCHGLAGNSEILVLGENALEDDDGLACCSASDCTSLHRSYFGGWGKRWNNRFARSRRSSGPNAGHNRSGLLLLPAYRSHNTMHLDHGYFAEFAEYLPTKLSQFRSVERETRSHADPIQAIIKPSVNTVLGDTPAGERSRACMRAKLRQRLPSSERFFRPVEVGRKAVGAPGEVVG